MAITFTLLLSTTYWIFIRERAEKGAILVKLLCYTYILLGVSGSFIYLTEMVETKFQQNYLSSIILFILIFTSILGFLPFKTQNINLMFKGTHNVKIIENLLITSQLFAIFFFLPFALESFNGDISLNRIYVEDKTTALGQYGILNTFASACAQLFVPTLTFGFIRLASEKLIWRAYTLFTVSLSYVIYILAYVGRDGVVYWFMSFILLYYIFKPHLAKRLKKKIINLTIILLSVILVPFAYITSTRFSESTRGILTSLFEYFGLQIQNFGDYSSLDRPLTLGMQNFPIFYEWGCNILVLSCEKFINIKTETFQIYLDQNKEPWLFATFISDFIGDFGLSGTIFVVILFSLICYIVCTNKNLNMKNITVARLLLIIFLFEVPYWGVYYFRFSISNGYIVVNLFFIFFVFIITNITKKTYEY